MRKNLVVLIISCFLFPLTLPIIANASEVETEMDYDTLKDEYDSLKANYAIIQKSWANMFVNYDPDLINEYNSLLDSYDSLSADYETLQNNYNELLEKYEQLENSTTKSESNVSDISTELSDDFEIKSDSSISESIIYNDNDVIIKVTGLESNANYEKIRMQIENNSSLNLSFSSHSFAVNGLMSDESIYHMYVSVASGKKASTTLDISKEWMKNNQIDSIGSIDLLIWAYDDAVSYKAFDTGVLSIYSDNFDNTIIRTYVGDEIYNSNGIIVKYMSRSHNRFYFSLANNNDYLLDFDIANVSINDWTYDTGIDIFDLEVLPNCEIMFILDIDSDFTKTNSIENIDSIDFNFNIRQNGDYFDEFSTDTITLTM